MTDARQALGAAGEAFVAEWFERSGFTVVAKNWYARGGELDLVVERGELLVFVEVRSVSTQWLRSPTVTVNTAKQARVARAADQFLQQRGLAPAQIRFDVAGVTRRGRRWVLELVENAFVPPWSF